MKKILYLIALITSIYACSLTDSDQPIPSYLNVNSVSISTTLNQGAPTHKITDVWVYADNQLLGVFPVPAKVPVIVTSDTTEFLIFPGIRNNGEQSRAFTYNVMDQIRFTAPLAPGDVIERDFTFQYKEEAIFEFVEGFEGSAHIFTNDVDEDPNTLIEITEEDMVSGIRSGKITLTEEHSTFTAATQFTYDGEDNAGLDSYLEIEYKMDMPLLLGISYARDGQSFAELLIQLNPTSEWNKTYVDYTRVLSNPAVTSYKIFISADLNSINEEVGTIYLDNLKFVHL